MGSVAVVPRLKELERNDSSLRSAAREAIAVIQSRASGAAPGQLSLAIEGNGESGQLSLTADGGPLSLAAPGTGELSLARAGAAPPSPAAQHRPHIVER